MGKWTYPTGLVCAFWECSAVWTRVEAETHVNHLFTSEPGSTKVHVCSVLSCRPGHETLFWKAAAGRIARCICSCGFELCSHPACLTHNSQATRATSMALKSADVPHSIESLKFSSWNLTRSAKICQATHISTNSSRTHFALDDIGCFRSGATCCTHQHVDIDMHCMHW